MELPRLVVIGSGIVEKAGNICTRLGFEGRALLLSGPRTVEIAGKTVAHSLESSGLKTTLAIVNDPTLRSVEKAVQAIRRAKPSVVVAVGGGKVIDVAKLGSAQERKPFVSVPTAASHDGIASTHASVRGIGGSISIRAQAPTAIIADTKIIVKSPRRLIAAGCGDVVAKLTAVKDWQLAHRALGEYYGEYAANLALMSAELVMQNAKLIGMGGEEELRVLLEALISCGVAASIAGSTRPCSGSEHLFSHALDELAPKPALHGEQCGIGTIMMARLHGLDWEEIRKALSNVGAPTTSEDLDIGKDLVVRALVEAQRLRPERYTILSERKLTHEEAEQLAKETGVVS